jgi:protein-disulfide isomerase
MTLSTKHLLIIFIPSIILVTLAVFMQVIRYAPTKPDAYLNANNKDTAKNSSIPIFDDDPIIGRRDAAKTVIVFGDIACSHCQEELSIFASLTEQYPKGVKFIWKSLPVIRVPYPSDSANSYSYCANQQGKFLDFAKEIIKTGTDSLTKDVIDAAVASVKMNQNELNKCLTSGQGTQYQSKVESLAGDLNIQTVPTAFFNQKQIDIPATIEGWKTLLEL